MSRNVLAKHPAVWFVPREPVAQHDRIPSRATGFTDPSRSVLFHGGWEFNLHKETSEQERRGGGAISMLEDEKRESERDAALNQLDGYYLV